MSKYSTVVTVVAALATFAVAQEQSNHLVTFFPAASETRPEGVLRIVNNSDESGSVTIIAVDDAGDRSDELALAVGANRTIHLDPEDLESGNSDLTGSAGTPQGDWWLSLTSDLNLEVQAYARNSNGALWEMRETATSTDGIYRVATLNPGSNVNQVGSLRLVNPGDESAEVSVSGVDDAGASAGPGVTIDVPPGESRTFTAAELESGVASSLTGSLGDGQGKWRLSVESGQSIQVMSLVASPTGHLTNLSTEPSKQPDGVHRVPLFPPASDELRQGFARVVNNSDMEGEIRIEAFDDTDWDYETLTLAVGANEVAYFNSNDLELGNTDKGLSGSTGAGEGDWRLELTSDLDIQVLSYVRTVGRLGYVTPMHDTAAQETSGLMRYYVPVFHPSDYEGQESRLHLVNLGANDLQVGIVGLDDDGQSSPEGDVSLTLAGGETKVLTAVQLESGDDGLDGKFGTGSGSWRLYITAQGQLQVMNLGYSSDGFLANLSRGYPTVRISTTRYPDLVVGKPSVGNDNPDTGELFTLSVTVTNQGDADAEETRVRYYKSTNAHISTSDTEIDTDRVAPLSSGEISNESVTVTAPSEAGEHYYGACVDEVDGESDTTNNCSTAVSVTVPEPPKFPDLVVVSPSVSDSQPDTGSTFTLSVSVRNTGDGASPSTTLRYYLSTDANITTSDTSIGTDAVTRLEPSGREGESISLSAPDDPGTYYYGACVDAVDGETNTSNNCSTAVEVTAVETVPPAPPDLVVISPSVSNGTLEIGDDFTLRATVRNQGGSPSLATTLRYYQSRSATISTGDTEVGTDAIGSLGVTQSNNQNIELTAPLFLDTYYYGACVDVVADESDTTNNCSDAVSVEVIEPPTYPDLVVLSPSASRSDLKTGELFEFSVTVRNIGDASSPATTLRYYLSTDSSITTSDTQVDTQGVNGLGPFGAGDDKSVELSASLTTGAYYYGACVDAVPDESNTANNCSSLSVKVTVAPSATYYGAVAVNQFGTRQECSSAWGLSLNQVSELTAKNLAVKACLDNVPHDDPIRYCSMFARTFRYCGAVASGYTRGTFEFCHNLGADGDTKGATEARALAICASRRQECQIVASGCNSTR